MWHHKKKCIPVKLQNNAKVEELEAKLQLVMENQKHQTEFVKMVAPVMKAIGENGGITSQNNCNNTTNNTINNNINIHNLNELLKNVDHEKDIIILDDVGHFPYFESPDQINKVLIKILDIS